MSPDVGSGWAAATTASWLSSARHGSPQGADGVTRVLGLGALAVQTLIFLRAGCNRPPRSAGVHVDLDHVCDRALLALGDEIGRASCRERVSLSGVGDSGDRKKSGSRTS